MTIKSRRDVVIVRKILIKSLMKLMICYHRFCQCTSISMPRSNLKLIF
jgi:hypothetical protein